MSSENTKSYFEQSQIWQSTMLPYQKQVLADIIAVLPPDVKSILDVGCGNGLITNALPKEIDVVGFDRSEAALRYVQRQKVVGDIKSLPFEDESFDLVMANDIIEHLTLEEREQGLKELARVASKYIIITVPFLEDLNQGMTKCDSCGSYYHTNHHLASFDLHETENLLVPFGYQCHGQILSGDTWDDEPPEVILAKRLLVLELAATDAPQCSYCGSKNVATCHSSKLITDKLVSNLCINNPDLIDWSARRTECINLYTKNNSIVLNHQSLIFDASDRKSILDKEKLVSNHINFQKPELFRRKFLPLFSRLPYYLCDTVSSEGAILSDDQRILLGFFCSPHPISQEKEIQLSGRCETDGIIIISSYDGDKQSYISPIEVQVNKNFDIKIPFPQANLSPYGILFEVKAKNCSVVFSHASITNVETDEIFVYKNNNPELVRFWRLNGTEKVYLSLALYGKYIIEKTWMFNPSLLTKKSLPTISSSNLKNLSYILKTVIEYLVNKHQGSQETTYQNLADG